MSRRGRLRTPRIRPRTTMALIERFYLLQVHSLGMVHVKCTRFFNINSTMITSTGIAGDRRFVLLDGQDCLISPSKHGLIYRLNPCV
ncbi:hypothetical protein ASD12_25875 [Mesorhizobium sp. Root102]|nr:hypothetical protein ASD12_25875 [Mesorhizobium sp. Root102]